MASKCSVCDDNVQDGAHCSACKKEVHFACAAITEGGYRRLGDRKQTWRCPKCKQSGNQSPAPEKHLQPPKDSNVSTRSPSPLSEATDVTVLSEIRDLAAKLVPLSTLSDEVKALRAEIMDMKNELSKEFNDKFKEFNGKVTKLEERVEKMEKVQDRVMSIEVALDRLKQVAEDSDQWSRMNNAEIKGVPESSNENLFNIVGALGSRINYAVDKTQINFVTRVPTRDHTQPKPIIISFINRYAKENFVAAARSEIKVTSISAAHLGLNGNFRIFVNDHLTPVKKELLTKTKKLAKEKDFAFSWVKHARIYVRKDVASPVIHIKSASDLTKIK